MTDDLNLVGKRVDKILEAQKKTKVLYQQVFNTESGREVIKDLKRIVAYNTPLGAQNSETCNYVLGQRELVMYILNLIEED